MKELLTIIEQAFDVAESLKGVGGTLEVKRLLQQCAAQLDIDTALRLRSRITSGPGVRNSGTTVVTNLSESRFSRTPPQIFIDPNLMATGEKENAHPVANGEVTQEQNDVPAVEPDAQDVKSVEAIYLKILKMTPEVVVRTYGESSIEGMIKVLKGKIIAGRKPVQKAAFLITLIKKQYEGVLDQAQKNEKA